MNPVAVVSMACMDLVWYLGLSQAALQSVTGVSFAPQTLQISLQPLLSLPDVLQQLSGLCACLHCLQGVKRSKDVNRFPNFKLQFARATPYYKRDWGQALMNKWGLKRW